MTCTQAKQWLLHAELPGELTSAPDDVASHLTSCAECRACVAHLQRFERDWREQPISPSANESRERLLQRHERRLAVPSRKTMGRGVPRWLVAASLLLAVGLATWFVASPQKARAESDVIEQLIDWNLQLSETDSGAEREQIFASRVESLRTGVGKLPEEDRPFAESLIKNGEFLTSNSEPLEMADRFTAVADQLVSRMNAASVRSDARTTAKLAKQYQFITSRGIEAQVERAIKAAALEETRQRKLDKIAEREAKRREKLEKMHEVAPAAPKKELRKLLDQTPMKPKKNPNKKTSA